MEFSGLSELIVVGLFIVYIIIKLNMASWMQEVAVMKGHKDKPIFKICFWLGIGGYIYVLSLPDRIVQIQNQQIIKLLSDRKEK